MYVCYLGKFGLVYKGTWTHQNDENGEMVSDVVALKSIKSMHNWSTRCTAIIIAINNSFKNFKTEIALLNLAISSTYTCTDYNNKLKECLYFRMLFSKLMLQN